MLSYRHSFHAGNFADVLKHSVLVAILEYLTQKDKPFEYIDTHAGAGLYDLQGKEALKLGEYAQGVGKLERSDFPQLRSYFAVLDKVNQARRTKGLARWYPGSPAIALSYLRPQDRAWLFELHPADYQALANYSRAFDKVRVEQSDGLAGLLSRLPPTSRRALVLVDPSYEIKADYEAVIETALRGHKKFPSGVYLIWYPVVDRAVIARMEKQLVNSGVRDIQQFELGLVEDAAQRGMTSSGLFVINPPWTLKAHMDALLPGVAETLKQGSAPIYQSRVLVPE